MSRLPSHLRELASLALAVLAAAVSHSVHVERSASSRPAESRNQLTGPTDVSRKPRSGSASTEGTPPRRRARRRAGGAERAGTGGRASRVRRPQDPHDRPMVVGAAGHPPRARRPHHVDQLRPEPGVERGVDRAASAGEEAGRVSEGVGPPAGVLAPRAVVQVVADGRLRVDGTIESKR
jgi:hypothetical protein